MEGHATATVSRREAGERPGAVRSVRRLAGMVFAVAVGAVVAFELALALGVPWGEYAMGGSSPGVYPAALRAGAVVQAVLLVVLALVVLSRAGVILSSWSRVSRWAIWLVVAISMLALLLNLATPSSGERSLWAPVAAVLLLSSLTVVLSARRQEKSMNTTR
jgi:hypothetical protein